MKNFLIIKKKSFLIELSLFLFVINALLKYFLPSSITKLLPILSLIVALISCFHVFLNIRLPKMISLFLVFITIWGIGSFYSPSISRGLGFVLSFLIAILITFFLYTKKINFNFIVLVISIVCSVYAILTIIHSINPNLINLIDSKLYTGEELVNIQSWARNGWFSGIFQDRAPTAFYSTLLCNCGIFYLINNKNRKKTSLILGIAFYFLGMISLLLTAKRGLFLGCVISSILVFCLYKHYRHERIWKTISILFLMSGIGLVVLMNIETSREMIERFLGSDDFFSGRLDIYNNMFNYISNSLIFGSGTASADTLLGIGGHNIYLTTLMENGIIGFISFIIAFFYPLFFSIKNIRKQIRDNLAIFLFAIFIMVFFLFYGMSGNPLYDNYILYFYALSILIVANIDYQKKKEN